MADSELKRTKIKLLADIELAEGTRLVGAFFLSPGQRLSDLLNDDRAFLPIEAADGSITLIQKRMLSRVTPLQAGNQAYEGNDPYRILNLSENASDDEVKEAYRVLMQENHPDRINAAGLSDEFSLLANKRTARINDAYNRITRMRAAEKRKPVEAE